MNEGDNPDARDIRRLVERWILCNVGFEPLCDNTKVSDDIRDGYAVW